MTDEKEPERSQFYGEIAACILSDLAHAYDTFLILPERFARDREEFMHAVHAAQNITMAWLWHHEHFNDPPPEEKDG